MNLLPNEIILNIIKNIPSKHILNVMLINKKFNELSNSNYIWKCYLDRQYPDYKDYYHIYCEYYDDNLEDKNYKQIYKDTIIINTPLILQGNKKITDYLKNNEVYNKTIIITDGCDTFLPKRDHLSAIKSTIVYFHQCEKNFVYYCLNECNFPNAKIIYLNSHPCEANVLWRFKNSIIYLHEYHIGYKNRWASSNDKIISISSKEYNEALSKTLSQSNKPTIKKYLGKIPLQEVLDILSYKNR